LFKKELISIPQSTPEIFPKQKKEKKKAIAI
jgi:hypothetical protein